MFKCYNIVGCSYICKSHTVILCNLLDVYVVDMVCRKTRLQFSLVVLLMIFVFTTSLLLRSQLWDLLRQLGLELRRLVENVWLSTSLLLELHLGRTRYTYYSFANLRLYWKLLLIFFRIIICNSLLYTRLVLQWMFNLNWNNIDMNLAIDLLSWSLSSVSVYNVH